jgi:hypothetical protein
LENGARIALKVYMLGWQVPGAQLFWDLSRFQGLVNETQHAVSSKWVSDRWDDWQKYLCEVGLRPCDHLWKSVGHSCPLLQDRFNWRRRLPGHAVSTPGLLLILAHRAAYARPKTSRPRHAQVLAKFMDLFMGSEPWSMKLSMDLDAKVSFGQQPVGECRVEVEVDGGGRVELQGMIDILSDASLGCQLRKAWSTAFEGHTSVHIASFLVHTFTSKAYWLLKQLLFEFALLVHLVFPELGFSDNPMDVSHDFDNLLARRRPDRELMDRLAEGRGVTGSKTASNPHQFARAFAALRPYMQKLKCPVSRLWQRQLNEMLWAGRVFFRAART